MGADLYIEPIYTEHKAEHQPAWDKAVELRDLHMKEHNCSLIWNMDGTIDTKKTCAILGKLQAAVEAADNVLFQDNPGYFRDSYNNSSIFWRLGRSWWRDTGTWLNKDNNMSPRRAKNFLVQIKALPIKAVTKDEEWASKMAKKQIDEWNTYFVEKKARFEAFLQRAVDAKQYIHFSV